MFTIEAYNTICEKTSRSFEDREIAEKVFSAMVFMCYGTNMRVFLKNENDEIIDSWEMPKGARRLY